MLSRERERVEQRTGGAAGPGPGLAGRCFRRFDAFVRAWLGIFEFTNDERCVLRLSLERLRKPLELSDGTRAQPGDWVAELHLWNEHLPPTVDGADVAWAAIFHRRFVHSMHDLAEYIELEPACRQVVAFRARAMFEGWGEQPRLPRIGRRLGFEPIADRRAGATGWLLSWGGSLLARGLLLAYNPGGVRGRPLHRRPQEFWISRNQLLERYGKNRRDTDTDARGHAIDRPAGDSGRDGHRADPAHAVGDGRAAGGDRLGRDAGRRYAGHD